MAHALPGPSGLTPKRLYEFIDAGSRMAKDPFRKEGKLKVFWHLKRLSGKFLMMAMTQGGPLHIFSSSHSSSRRNLRTVTYLVALEGLRDMLANKLILSWQNIIGAHKKMVEGIWWRLGREIKLPDLWMFTHTLALGTAIESFGFPTWVACVGLELDWAFFND